MAIIDQTILGIDGCRTGWVVAQADPTLTDIKIYHATTLLDIVSKTPPQKIAIDMPIGLPEKINGPGREAEQAVRPMLGRRQSSLFSIPSRSAIYADTYQKACELALQASNPPRKVAKQGFNLFPKIIEIDQLLQSRKDLIAIIHESHPEAAFVKMNSDKPLGLPKKVKNRPFPEGLELRKTLLKSNGIDFSKARIAQNLSKKCSEDDMIDALAMLWIAQRLAKAIAKPHPDPPKRDDKDIPIAIWL